MSRFHILRPLISGLAMPLTAISLLSGTAFIASPLTAHAAELHVASAHTLIIHPDGEEIEMVFLSDPFADVPPAPRSEFRRKATKSAPKPPKPPTPRRDEDRENFDDAIEEFERDMEAFEEEMEAFGEEMAEWGEAMGEWGEKMGAVGEAMGEIAEACRDHQDESDDPIVISRKVERTDKMVKAVCATGGEDRYRSAELARFVSRHPDLSEKEKSWFLEHRNDPSTSYRN